jgi:hypothetical protein
VDLALDVFLLIAVPLRERGPLSERLFVIASAVDNNGPPLFYYVLGKSLLEVVCEFRYLIKGGA